MCVFFGGFEPAPGGMNMPVPVNLTTSDKNLDKFVEYVTFQCNFYKETKQKVFKDISATFSRAVSIFLFTSKKRASKTTTKS